MLEIIPNWHPIFVHFTVALLSLSAALFVVTPFIKSPLQEQWRIVARWTLWFGAAITVITALTGLYAYNTVAHDTPSHVAMTDHRNWAIATMTLFFTLAIFSVIRVRRQQALGTVFVVLMFIAAGLLSATAWRGGEVVYRYGLGVMSLPESDGEGHAHEHADGHGHGDTDTAVSNHHGTEMSADAGMGHGDGDDDMSMDDFDMATMDGHDDGHDHEH